MPIEKFEQQLGSAEDLTKLDDAQLKNLEDKVTKIESEIKEKSEAPSHNEMLDVFRGGKRETKWDLTEQAIDKAFRDLGIENLDLTKVKRLEHDETPDFDEGREKGKPQIFYKQIMVEKPRNFIQKAIDKREGREPELIPSDQVLVIVNLNNGEKPEENTVACMVTRQKEGKMDKTDPSALSTLSSEEQYVKSVKSSGSDPESQLQRGELTTQKYREKYTKVTGHSIERHWEDWDKNVVKTADYYLSEKNKGELMERINEDYTNALVETQKRKEEIVDETKKRLEAKNKKKSELINDSDFTFLLENLYQISKSGEEKDIKRMEDLKKLYSKAFTNYNWNNLWEKEDLLV